MTFTYLEVTFIVSNVKHVFKASSTSSCLDEYFYIESLSSEVKMSKLNTLPGKFHTFPVTEYV